MSSPEKNAVRVVAGVEYSDERTAAFRRTLDRLPDEIALAIGLRVFEVGDPCACVCGWAVREAIARETNLVEWPDADTNADGETEFSQNGLARRYGGDRREWDAIFTGVCHPFLAEKIEEALFDRVMAASEATSLLRSRNRGVRND